MSKQKTGLFSSMSRLPASMYRLESAVVKPFKAGTIYIALNKRIMTTSAA